MLICLDYDGTYTEDPDLWDQFIVSALRADHTVICATMRYEDSEGDVVKRNLASKVSQIYFTDRLAKQAFLERQGVFPDVWIDDSPKWLLHNAF